MKGNLEFLLENQGDNSNQIGWKTISNESFGFLGGNSEITLQYHYDEEENQNPITRLVDLQIDSLFIVIDYLSSVIIPSNSFDYIYTF